MSFLVKREQCETCIFHAGNPMHLQPGRVREMVRSCQQADSHIICHESLNHDEDTEYEDEGMRPMLDGEAVCRGFIDAGYTSQLLRIAERLGMIEEVA